MGKCLATDYEPCHVEGARRLVDNATKNGAVLALFRYVFTMIRYVFDGGRDFIAAVSLLERFFRGDVCRKPLPGSLGPFLLEP